MALKAGTDNKRNVIIAGVLFCVLAYLVYSQLLAGPSTPAPVVQRATTRRVSPGTTGGAGGQASNTLETGGNTGPASRGGPASQNGPAARKISGSSLDPALHEEKLAASESIEYAGSGRNIFSSDSAPVDVPAPAAPARPVETAQVDPGPPPPPQPPAIDLHYFGYSADKAGKRQAFLLHGDDIFAATAGDIVNHRYKVVTVDAHSVQVTDLSYNNTQTLPLSAN